MSETVEILQTGPHEYAVTISEEATQTQHRVTVPPSLLGELGLTAHLDAADGGGQALHDVEERVVRESFIFLLEREPATSILREFQLDVIGRYFADYKRELRTRLGTAP